MEQIRQRPVGAGREDGAKVSGGGQGNDSTPRSLRAAINAMCKACIYDVYARGTWRQQVTACTSTGCPLYPYRPRTYGSPLGRNGRINAEKRDFSPDLLPTYCPQPIGRQTHRELGQNGPSGDVGGAP